MSEEPASFSFRNYTVRKVREDERYHLGVLIDQDVYHRENMTPDYFLNCRRGEDAWALEKDGRTLFYFKTQTAVRMGILFAQGDTPQERHENRFALIEGLAWIEAILGSNGFLEILFDTRGPELAAFAKRHLGFSEAGNLLTHAIVSADPPKAGQQPWEASPQASQTAG